MTIEVLRPDWPAPANVHAAATLRGGGISQGGYKDLNLAIHTGDDPVHVAHNRALLVSALQLPAEPGWLNQVHGVQVVSLSSVKGAATASAWVVPTADASFSTEPDTVCAVLTADCLPVLFCNRAGTWVAAAHAGWRGLCAGVLEQTLQTYSGDRADVLAWLGPAIGPTAFEVGPEVRAAFCAQDPDAGSAFQPGAGDRWLADLYQLARQRLHQAGVDAVFGGGWCTYSDAARFFSYRRDPQTGRQASLIWRSAR